MKRGMQTGARHTQRERNTSRRGAQVGCARVDMHVESIRRRGKDRQVVGAERGNRRRKKNPRKEVSKHRQKVTCWVTHWNGKGR